MDPQQLTTMANKFQTVSSVASAANCSGVIVISFTCYEHNGIAGLVYMPDPPSLSIYRVHFHVFGK